MTAAEAMRIRGDGVDVHVAVDGPADAPTVVFLHGVTGSGETWSWLPDEITRGRRILRVDFRGHGRSDHAPGTYDVPHYGADVVAVIRELSPSRPVVVVGHSLGGTTGWWLAQNHPELVAAAFLEDPPLLQGDMGAPENRPTRDRFEAMRAEVLADRAAGRSEEEIRTRLAASSVGPPGSPTFAEAVCEDALTATAFARTRFDVGVIDGAIDGSTLAPLDTESPVSPAVFILRADDAFGAAFTSERAGRLKQGYPGVEIVEVPGAGHGIHSERRHRPVFVEHLRQFLDRHAPRPRGYSV